MKLFFLTCDSAVKPTQRLIPLKYHICYFDLMIEQT